MKRKIMNGIILMGMALFCCSGTLSAEEKGIEVHSPKINMDKYRVDIPWNVEIFVKEEKITEGLGFICIGGNTEETQPVKYGPATNKVPLYMKELDNGYKHLKWDIEDNESGITVKYSADFLPDRIKIFTDYEMKKEVPGIIAMGWWLFDGKLESVLGKEYEAETKTGEIIKGQFPREVPAKEMNVVDQHLKSFKFDSTAGRIRINLSIGEYSQVNQWNTIRIVPGRGLYVNLLFVLKDDVIPAGYFNSVKQEIIFE